MGFLIQARVGYSGTKIKLNDFICFMDKFRCFIKPSLPYETQICKSATLLDFQVIFTYKINFHKTLSVEKQEVN